VSYGEGRFDGGGQCPPTHPKRIMGLFYEFIFHVSHIGVDVGLYADGQDHAAYKPGGRKPLLMTRWQYTDETGVWSNGDDVGYSLHGAYLPNICVERY
jgi:hypothetical protein